MACGMLIFSGCSKTERSCAISEGGGVWFGNLNPFDAAIATSAAQSASSFCLSNSSSLFLSIFIVPPKACSMAVYEKPKKRCQMKEYLVFSDAHGDSLSMEKVISSHPQIKDVLFPLATISSNKKAKQKLPIVRLNMKTWTRKRPSSKSWKPSTTEMLQQKALAIPSAS